MRGLSQALHPSILEEAGLESTIEWYLPTVERQVGIAISYERSGPARPVDGTAGIHVYRVLQEALNNVARHAGADRAWVRLRHDDGVLELEVEDHGTGFGGDAAPRPRPRRRCASARDLLGGTIEFLTPAGRRHAGAADGAAHETKSG